MPVVVENHEQRIAPRPRAKILPETDAGERLRVAGIKIIRCGRRIKLIARVLCVNGDGVALVALVEVKQRRLLVISVEQKYRRGLRDEAKERAL